MKRPIKFRGYDTADSVRDTVTFTLDELLSGVDHYELVDPDTIVQFIGYDMDGREVYEGDTVISPNGYEYIAELCGYPPLIIDKLKEAKS